MKSTGIIRRIDELGRVSIPKEIRRTARVRDGDPLEIFLDDSGNITLKKYSAIGSLEEFAPTYAESIRKTIGHNVIITDRDNVITYNGYSQRDLKGNRLSQEVEKVIEERQYRMFHMNEQIRLILNDQYKYSAQLIVPIIVHGDPIGSVILTSGDPGTKFGVAELRVAQSAAMFLGKQMEV